MNEPSGRPVLLDVNVLIALFDPAHVHHEAAHSWFENSRGRGWRTCSLTESGFLRILSHPSYPNGSLPISTLAHRLEQLKNSGREHAFWADQFSTSRWIVEANIACSSGSLTDACLLRLAANYDGVLATFDLRIKPSLIGEEVAALVEHIRN